MKLLTWRPENDRVLNSNKVRQAEKLEAVLGQIREERKVRRARELLRDRLNYRRIIEKLRLK